MNGFDVLTVFHKMGALTDKGLEIVCRGLTAVEDSWYGADDRSRFRCYMPKKWMVRALNTRRVFFSYM